MTSTKVEAEPETTFPSVFVDCSATMQTQSLSPSQPAVRQFPRVTLACVQCRERHIKCDAQLPFCSRCQTEGKQCGKSVV